MEASATDPVSLQEVFALLPEVRQARGRRHPLLAILNLTAVALLAGMKSLEAIAQFARDHGPAGRGSRLHPLAHPLQGHPLQRLPPPRCRRLRERPVGLAERRCPDLGDTLALDGKTLRGSASYHVPGVHLLSAYAPRVAAVIAQVRVDAKTNEHKAALELLGVLPLEGKIVTGDAMFCQRDFCEEVIAAGGDYVLTVKDNQPTVMKHIAAMFAESSAFSPLPTAALGRGAGHLRDAQQGTRAAGEADAAGDADPGEVPGLARGCAGFSGPPRAVIWRTRWRRRRSTASAASSAARPTRSGCWGWCGVIGGLRTGCIGCGT